MIQEIQSDILQNNINKLYMEKPCCATRTRNDGTKYIRCWKCMTSGMRGPTPILIEMPTPIKLTPKKTPTPKGAGKMGDLEKQLAKERAALEFYISRNALPGIIARQEAKIAQIEEQIAQLQDKPISNAMRGPTRQDKPISTARRRPLRKPLDVYTGPGGGQYLKVNGKKQYVSVFRDGETSYILNNAYADKFGLPRGSRVPVNIVY